MGRFTSSTQRIFDVFEEAQWKALGILVLPADMSPKDPVQEYVRVSVIHGNQGLNQESTSGIVHLDIFTPNGMGPARALAIADQLDGLFERRSVFQGGSIQTQHGTLGYLGIDSANPSLQRHLYSINFNYFGV